MEIRLAQQSAGRFMFVIIDIIKVQMTRCTRLFLSQWSLLVNGMVWNIWSTLTVQSFLVVRMSSHKKLPI